MLRASAATTGEVNGVRWQARRQLLRGRRLHRARRRTARPCRTTMRRRRRQSASLGWRHATRGTICKATLQYVDTERGSPGPYGSDPAQPLRRRRHASRAARPSASPAASRWMQPWFGAGEPRAPARRVRRRGLRPDLQEPVRHVRRQHASHARPRADRRVGECGVRVLGRHRVARRARRQHVHHGRADRRRRFRSSAACLAYSARRRWNASDRATVTAGVRGERITRDALPGDPLAFQPRPDFPEETINSVNPEDRRIVPASADEHAPARIVRHRHPSARRVRDRVHRQLGI